MKELSLHILDIVENSITASATIIEIEIVENPVKNIFSITIKDNGKGIDAETQKKILSPFYTTRSTRKVGLGLSLLKQKAEQTEGELIIESEIKKGTKVIANFKFHHIDRPILGDIAGIISFISLNNMGIQFIYKHITLKGVYIFNSTEVTNIIADTPSSYKILQFLKELINQNLISIKA